MKPVRSALKILQKALPVPTIIMFLTVSICLSFGLTKPVMADSSNGQPGPGGNGGTGSFSPMPPMFGSTFGGGDQSKPFTPIRSGIERFPSLGYKEASSPEDCLRFRYNSAPPTSGLYLRQYVDRNDVSGEVSPCALVHLLYKGNIVVFYDPTRLDKDSLESLKSLETNLKTPKALESQERFGYAVILVQSHAYKTPVVFSAWCRLLPIQHWDTIVINRFMSSYLGNPRKGTNP
jgi:hypothetical protein